MLFKGKGGITDIDLDRIRPNPAQPRRVFDDRDLAGLAQSIKANGLLQPLLVRRVGDEFELIAGERRLRACRIVGLKTASCVVSDCSSDRSAVLAMTENLQRQDLGIFEEAEGIRRLIEEWHVTQEEAAFRLGKSQSALANKMRLLHLSDSERRKIVCSGLTERHARAILRIEDVEKRERVLDTIIERQYNVRQTDEYVERLLGREKPAKQTQKLVIKDIRIFLNTISHAIETMKQSGVNAKVLQSETDDYFECVVRIPKARADAGGQKPA